MSELADKLIVEAFRTKHGLAKRITSAQAEYALQAEVIFEVNANNDLILKPQERFEYTLDEMLEGLTPEKVHGEINWGGPVGEEEW